MRACVSLGRTWLIHSELGRCLRGHVGWPSWAHGGSLGVGKVKADELEMRNLMKSPNAWRWKGYSVFCKSRTIGEDVTSI